MKKTLLLCVLLFATGIGQAFAWRYENKDWRFRINELDDKTDVDDSQWYKVFTRDNERVDILLFHTGSQSEMDMNIGDYVISKAEGNITRFKYHFLCKLDSLCLPIDSTYKLVYEKRMPFSCKLTRVYESTTGHKVKTVGFYTINVLYYFVEEYTDEPVLLNHMIINFKSSLINSSEGLFCIWQDIISGEDDKSLRAAAGSLIAPTLTLIWLAIVCFICVFFLIIPFFSDEKYFWGILFSIISLFAISFLCCHTIFMDWIMGYGPLWKVLLSIVYVFNDFGSLI